MGFLYPCVVVMIDGRKQFFDDQILTIVESEERVIIELEVMSENIHVFISPPPFESYTGIFKVLKGVTAKRLFEKISKLPNDFPIKYTSVLHALSLIFPQS